MSRRPNFLLIMADQWRADCLGCVSPWCPTPNLDRLAAGAMRFTNAVTISPICVPARLGFATGLYPHNTGVWGHLDHTIDPDRTPAWTQPLDAAGYHTALVGKAHLQPQPHTSPVDLRDGEPLMHRLGLRQVNETTGPHASRWTLCHMTARWQELGIWDAYRDQCYERNSERRNAVYASSLGLDEYYDSYVGREANEVLRAFPADEPWMLWASFGGPHDPWDTPEPWASRIDPATMPPARPAPTGRADRPTGHLDQLISTMQANEQIDRSPAQVARMRANYVGNIGLIDEWIGRLLATLEARGELDDTVIVFTSDHGEMNGDADCILKGNFLDGAVRVPLLVSTPATRATRGSTCAAPVEWMDVGPTLLDHAGLADRWGHARSLTPLLSNPDATHRDGSALSEINREYMLLTGDWKAMINRDGEVYGLFDCDMDPEEQRNLAGEPLYASVETALRLQLLNRLASSPTPQPHYDPTK